MVLCSPAHDRKSSSLRQVRVILPSHAMIFGQVFVILYIFFIPMLLTSQAPGIRNVTCVMNILLFALR